MVPKRRLIWPLLLALLVVTNLVAGCGGKSSDPNVDRSKLGKSLNLFNWSEYIPQEILTGFEKEYGVRVNYDAYSSNEEMMAKLAAGGATYDLAVPTTFMVDTMIKQGLLQPLDMALITNFSNLEAKFTNLDHDPGNKYSVPYMWGSVGIAYNTKYIGSEAPRKWSDLLDPKWKRHMVVLDDTREVIMIGLQANGYSRNDTNPQHLQQAQEWLKRLLPNVLAWDSDNPKGALVSEEAWIGVVWNGEAAIAMQESPDIQYVIPEEGSGIWLDSLVIPKDAPHPYAAHIFINYLLRPEVAAKLGEAYPYGLPNTEGYKLLPKSIQSNPAAYPPPEWLARSEYPEELGDATTLFERAFTELKATK